MREKKKNPQKVTILFSLWLIQSFKKTSNMAVSPHLNARHCEIRDLEADVDGRTPLVVLSLH